MRSTEQVAGHRCARDSHPSQCAIPPSSSAIAGRERQNDAHAESHKTASVRMESRLNCPGVVHARTMRARSSTPAPPRHPAQHCEPVTSRLSLRFCEAAHDAFHKTVVRHACLSDAFDFYRSAVDASPISVLDPDGGAGTHDGRCGLQLALALVNGLRRCRALSGATVTRWGDRYAMPC